MAAPETALLEVHNVTKTYDAHPAPLSVLNGVDLSIASGESVAVVGPSGCGKSTLLNLIGALDQPTSGSIRFEGEDIAALNEVELARFRNERIGFVFQLHHLLPQCSVLENVLIPTLVTRSTAGAKERAVALLERVGLAERLAQRPGTLSGGERQRTAVVRALINRPRLLLADEPTGALNEEGSESLAHLMLELNREEGMGLLVVTHSTAIANLMDRVLELHEGNLVPKGNPT
jgi:ABC-type lipoprotein export system ATPase subunit